MSVFPDTLLLKGKTPSQKLDSAGAWHNNYQVALLKKMIAAQLNLIDTGAINSFINPRTDSFFIPKDITPSFYGFTNYVGPEDTLITNSVLNVLKKIEKVVCISNSFELHNKTNFLYVKNSFIRPNH
ncbi:MAG: hypothetical protein JST21_04415, partial [Bacteroidetes bacterium]|nr:hypothetical protein [Bacteroidota bacterium]